MQEGFAQREKGSGTLTCFDSSGAGIWNDVIASLYLSGGVSLRFNH